MLVTNCHEFAILSSRSIFYGANLIKLVTRMLLFHKVWKYKMAVNTAVWFLSQNCYPCIINYFETVSTALTSQTKQFLTPAWVSCWWELIMVTVKCYGYKIPSRVTCTIVGCGRWWNVLNRNLYNSTTRLISRISVTKKMSPSYLIKLSHAPLPPFPSDTRNSKFYIPFILMYYHQTSISQLKCGQRYKNLPRL